MNEDERRLTNGCHCKRSEAIQGSAHSGCGSWISSSRFALLRNGVARHRQPFIGQSSLAAAACSGHTST